MATVLRVRVFWTNNHGGEVQGHAPMVVTLPREGTWATDGSLGDAVESA